MCIEEDYYFRSESRLLLALAFTDSKKKTTRVDVSMSTRISNLV